MTNLLSTVTGREILNRIACFVGRARMSRNFDRAFYMAFDAWRNAEQLTPGSGYFSLETLLNNLNSATQDEIVQLHDLLGHMDCLDGQSVADRTIYVDPTSGSDEDGDGSSSKPYASLEFMNSGSFPTYINHTYNIVFLSDYTYDGNLNFNIDFGPNGYLALIGVGNPSVVSGPFEVLTTGILDDGVGRFVQATGAVGADPSGQFLMAADGTDIGVAQAIHSMAAADTLITVNGSFLNIAPGDHVNVVRPPVTITCDHIAFQCRNAKGYTSLSKGNARISCYNLRIAITDLPANSKVDCVLIDNTCSQQMSFCQIVPPSNGTMRVTQRAELNTLNGETASAALASSTVTNFNEFVQDFDIAGLVIADSGLSLTCEGSVKFFSNRSVIALRKTGIIEYSSCDRMTSYECNGAVLTCLAEGRANAGAGGGIEVQNSHLKIAGFSALNSDNVVVVLKNSLLSLEETGVDSTYSTIAGYGVYCSGVSNVEIADAGARLTAATNAINFVTVNPAVPSAVPAAYGYATDAQSSMVKRLSA